MADPILNVTFGDGADLVGPALPKGKTNYTYTTSPCPGEGEYSIARNNRNCGGSVFRDHTFLFNESALNGYMMFINAYAPVSSTYFVDTVNNLCDGKTYLFSVAFGSATGCNSNEAANILFRIETLKGDLIEYSYAGAPNLQSFQMLRYANGFYFNLPAGESSVVVKIMNRSPDNHYCGNLLWIDDIQLRPTEGPKVSIAGGTGFVTSLCYQQNSVVSMYGKVEPPNMSVQWQQSLDSVSWQDIPGERNINYSRSFPVADTFLFRLRASEASLIDNVNCSMISDYIIVQVDGLPPPFRVTTNSPVCAGDPIKLSAQEGFAKYFWTGPSGFHDDIAYPQVNHTMLKDSGMYYVAVSSLGGCIRRDSVFVKMIGFDITASPVDTMICNGNSVRLKAGAGKTFEWSPAASLNNPNIADPVASPVVTTRYTVKASDDAGCTATTAVLIQLKNKEKVVASFSGPAVICRPYDTAMFNNESVGVIANYSWFFSNSQTSAVKDPPVQHFYTGNEKAYRVRLAIVDSAGCTDTTYRTIKVADNCYIAVPTAFTPNGDGRNDFLYPANAYKATDLLFRVYNRNGQLIFQTRDWSHKWDGKVNGMLEPTGVYIWTLDYKDAAHNKVSLKGTTTLIR